MQPRVIVNLNNIKVTETKCTPVFTELPVKC